MDTFRLICLATSLAGLAGAAPAYAQLGSVSNPPAQNLFNFQQPPRLDTGTGADAVKPGGLRTDRNGVVRHPRYRTRHRLHAG